MSLRAIRGIGPVTEGTLEEAGITSVEQLAAADAATLAAETGIAEGRIEAFIDRATAAGSPPNGRLGS